MIRETFPAWLDDHARTIIYTALKTEVEVMDELLQENHRKQEELRGAAHGLERRSHSLRLLLQELKPAVQRLSAQGEPA